jgi:hypothetical protein
MAYTKYSLTPADNNAAPPNGAPEGMLPSAVNDTMRDMMAQIRDVGDGIRGGTYTMTAPVITGGSITGVALSGNTLTNPVITGGSINNTTVGATTRSTGAFTTLASNGATTFTAGTASTTTTTGTAVITGGLGVSGRINAANFDGIVGANTAAAGNFTTLGATGVATFSAGTNSAPAITTTGDTNTGIFFPAADTIAFTEGGVEAMRITSAGNVGIGTTSPASRLQISTGADGANLPTWYQYSTATGVFSTGDGVSANSFFKLVTGIYNTASTNNIDMIVQSKDNNSDAGFRITAGAGTGPTTNNGYLSFNRIATNGTAITATERMRITSAGNVGIGTSSPSQVLDIVTSTGNSYIRNSNGAIETLTGVSSGLGAGATGSVSNHPYVFFTNNAERMRIDASGNLLVGTTTRFFTEKLTVGQSANNAGIRIGNTFTGSYTSFNYMSSADNAAGTGWSHFIGQSSGGAVNNIYIYGNGNIENANNSYGAISDIKLKENIVDATPKLDKLMQVKVRNYNLKGDYEQHKQIGVIAQELETVFPSLVEEIADKDSNGNVLETTTKSVKYSVFVPMLIKAMQEQQAMIETLTTRLNALEGK